MNKQQNFSGKWIALGKVTPTFSSDYKNALRILKISLTDSSDTPFLSKTNES